MKQHHQQPPWKKWEVVRVATGTVKKKKKVAGCFEKTRLVLSQDIKKAHVTQHLYLCGFELLSPALNLAEHFGGLQNLKEARAKCLKRSACLLWGSEAMAVSVKHAPVKIPQVPAPTSTSSSDIKTRVTVRTVCHSETFRWSCCVMWKRINERWSVWGFITACVTFCNSTTGSHSFSTKQGHEYMCSMVCTINH